MADDALSEAWEKAAKDITKGKNEGALQTLRAVDPQAIDPMTSRLVGEATWNIAKANDSKSDYRTAAMFLREASKKNPKDKKTSSLYNKLLNEMQEKRISETVIPRMFNNGGPTLAGMVVMFGGFLLVLGMITIANTESTTTDYIELNLSWSENGVTKTGTVSLELYPNDAPAHAENFKQLVVQGKYDGTQFHRIIDDFMIQGGD
ncbi:MAG: peptidylprolyl isomerase, partial [Candidatus Poseidoniaceae archaeon]